jgi:Kef-type K+ transport system membrane component KefB
MCGAGIWFVLQTGTARYSPPTVVQTAASPAASPSPESAPASPLSGISKNLTHPLSILILQLVVIIIASRLVGKLFLKIGQPRVMGEIVAGIVLGPSLLGQLSPETMAFLFPPASMEPLRLLSQVGVVLFMFVVGIDLHVGQLRKQAHAAVMVSHASIVVPFLFGVTLSLFFYQSLAPATTSFTPFALFMGIAMSITAFPVLARILEDRRMRETPLGNLAITCAAVDDVTAWCLLAMVIAIARADGVLTSIVTIALVLAFIGVILFVVKPFLARFTKVAANDQRQRRGLLALIIAFVLASAFVTEVIGIHALFGAFLAGVVVPPTEELRQMLKEKLEDFTLVILLPLFFAFTGLRMQVALLNDLNSWLLCGLIILIAIAGKLGGSSLMARWTGMPWRESVSLGLLMNTRGLVELIVLSIGYDLGILSARTFAMMVIMALVTTFMTGPLLSLVRRQA